jgi:hypothetical protein
LFAMKKMHRFAHLFFVLTLASAEAEHDLILYSFPSHLDGLVIPVTITSDYGYMVLNTGSIEEPIPLYILGDRKTQTVTRFPERGAFLEAVRRLAAGGTMAFYDKCLVPSSYGLKEPQEVWKDVESICREKGIRIEEQKLFCNCEDVVMEKIMSGHKRREAGQRKREQDGAGQPATRSESKSEDIAKPQPQAEGRSR